MIRQQNSGITACKNFEQALILHYYGELEEKERIKVQYHVEQCMPCHAYLQRLETLLPLTVHSDDPPPAFWQAYHDEIRKKLIALKQKGSWWTEWASLFPPWSLPALATGAVVALVMVITFGQGIWRSNDLPPKEEALMEILPIAENLEFFKTMEVLDAMDLLESLASQANESV